MRRTYTHTPFRCARLFLLSFLLLLGPLASWAQVPPSEGLVADSTELRVLRQFYQATDGDHWTNHTNWLQGTSSADFATWAGVGVANGDVVSLNFLSFNLQGSLPASIGDLAQLQFLNLTRNHGLTGTLPASIGRLQQLVTLYVISSDIGGPIPPELGQLRSLQTLALQRAKFTGTIPPELGQLPNLRYLSIRNETGDVPGTLNDLRGGIPAALGNLTKLTYLNISCLPYLGGSIPPELGKLSQLTFLELDGNGHTGSLPAALGNLTQLRELYLYRNKLSGALPAVSGKYSALGTAELAYNTFTGTLPASWLRLPQLGYLGLQGSELTDVESLGTTTGLPVTVRVIGNRLGFAALERLYTGPGQARVAGAQLLNQRPPARQDSVHYQLGQPLSLGLPQIQKDVVGKATYQYQWQRLVAGQWVNMPGDVSLNKTWAKATAAQQGLYRLVAHDSWFTDPALAPTELYSATVYADLRPYLPQARNRPDDTRRASELTKPLAAADANAPQPADMNYVRSWVPRVALTDAAPPAAPSWSVDQAQITTQYLDGLGRPLQTVRQQASPQRRDLVQPQAYDALGREPRQYLPYPDSVGGRGGYRYRALTEQQSFYFRTTLANGSIGPPPADDPTWGVARSGAAFAETQFEASPLNRVTAQGAPDEAWQLTSGHAEQRLERPNTALDSVPRFTPGYGATNLDPGYQGTYAAGELWGTDGSAPHQGAEVGPLGYRTIEWKDKLGQVVCKQVEGARAGTAAAPRSRWLRTCYVYDDFQRLRFVLQPEASKLVLRLGNKAAALPAAAAPFRFHYRYDGRGRQLAKQVPGQSGETLVVFDQLDRPILSQDAQQRVRKEWGWTKYDALGRIILSGLVTRSDGAAATTLQATATADTATSHQYEQRTADQATFPHGYTTTSSFPRLGQAGFGAGQVLSVSYYDDYNFDNDAAATADAQYNTSTDGQFPSGQAPVADALRTQGLPTRTKTRVLGVAENDQTQAAWLTTTTFYDERARPVQVQTTSARRDPATQQPYVDLLTTCLDFTGQVMQSVATHQGPSHQPVLVKEYFRYDHTGRLLSTRQQLPGEARAALLDSVQYNELGQVLRKTLATGRLKQDVDYTYNIRGWLTSLNDPYQPLKGDLFNLSLHYDWGFTKGYEQYNGNLTGQTWRGRDGVQRAYGYVYDPLNRLWQGDFVARTTTTPATPTAGLWKAEQDNYRLSFVSYDDNGNIRTLRRQGLLQNATRLAAKQYGAVDNLAYAYQGNRLLAVDDQVTGNQLPRPQNYNGAPTSLAGDFQEQGVQLGEEYLYDANGNLTQDKNKGITGIAYNHLNLPRQIHFGQGADSIVFRYTASGQKVAKLVYQTGKPLGRTDYLGPYQYEQDSLKFFPHAEGRVLRFVSYDPAGQAIIRYQREFTLKDHLGNLRLAYRAGQVRTLTATLEQDEPTHKRESQQFDSLSVSPPIAVSTGLAHSGTFAALLNAGGSAPQPLGPLTQLGVQQGDTVTVSAYGFYPQAQRRSFWFSLGSFLAGLVGQQPSAPVGGDPGRGRKNLPLLQVGVVAGLPALKQATGGVPLGYLRVLVFDKDSALVSAQTQQVQLSQLANGGYEPLSTRVILAQDGYVTAYVGNESDVDVFFDDVHVEHHQGLQVQENQYDPAGLELAGLTPASPGIKGLNNYRFNGKEFQADLGLAWNHQDWRFLDPQLLRWHSGDPELENGQESWTPYSFGYDNAVRYADANGREPGGPGDLLLPGTGFLGTLAAGLEAIGSVVAAPEVLGTALLGGLIYLGVQAGGTAQPHYMIGNEPIYTSQAQYDKAHPTTSAKDGNGRVNADGGNQPPKQQSPTPGRQGAYKEAKRDAKVPVTQNPQEKNKVPMTDRSGKTVLDKNGKPIMTREMTHTTTSGNKVIIQDHSAGHQFNEGGVGDQPGHFNVRPANPGDNTRTGNVPGTKEHYPF